MNRDDLIKIEGYRRFLRPGCRPLPGDVRFPLALGCFYRFSFGTSMVPGMSNFGCSALVPAAGVSHVDLVFFTLPKYLPKFEGRILDHTPDRSFFLRKP